MPEAHSPLSRSQPAKAVRETPPRREIMATSSPVVAASAAKAATPAEAAAKLGATYPHEQMATRPLDLNPAHWYAAIKWHYDGGTLNWPMIIYIGLCHYWAVLGLTRLATVHTYTLLWAYVLWPITGLGITAGVHRLWSHRSYTAGPALRCLLMLMNSIANQGSIFHWARDHRVHHKHSETTADPHNAQRGFFYAHVGWLLCKKHPDVVKEEEARLQRPEAGRLRHVPAQAGPVVHHVHVLRVPRPRRQVRLGRALLGRGLGRRLPALHLRAALDVARQQRGAHLRRPPLQRAVARREPDRLVLAVGEGWHNWHHQYPYDYAASEFGITSQFNPTKLFIDFFCLLGMASNPKRATSSWERTKMKRDKGVFQSNFVLCMGDAPRARTPRRRRSRRPAPSSPTRVIMHVRRHDTRRAMRRVEFGGAVDPVAPVAPRRQKTRIAKAAKRQDFRRTRKGESECAFARASDRLRMENGRVKKRGAVPYRQGKYAS